MREVVREARRLGIVVRTVSRTGEVRFSFPDGPPVTANNRRKSAPREVVRRVRRFRNQQGDGIAPRSGPGMEVPLMRGFEFELTGSVRAESYDDAVTAIAQLATGHSSAGRIEQPRLEVDGREVDLAAWTPKEAAPIG